MQKFKIFSLLLSMLIFVSFFLTGCQQKRGQSKGVQGVTDKSFVDVDDAQRFRTKREDTDDEETEEGSSSSDDNISDY